MPSYDSIVVGEDWISEHYFTTDSTKESFQGKVVELRKQWDAEAAEGRDTVRRHLLAAAGELQTALSALAEHPDDASAAHALIRRTFGFPEELTDYTGERAGTELRLPAAQLAGITSTLSLQATPVTSVDDLLDPQTGLLLEPGEEDGKPITAVSKAVSAAFRADEPPAFVVVQAGQWLLLAEAERWAEGRYLAVDLLVVAERRDDKRGGEIDRVVAMLSRQALLPDADGNIWWTGVLEDSVKHTVGVSKDLREGIRLSIEIIANDVVRRRDERGLPLDQIDAQQLAKQSLRFLYRILFLLYAEASPEMKVLPSGAPEYGEGYGLDRLRELTLTELVSPQAKSGTHLYESLATLFRLVDAGHSPDAPATDTADDPAPGLEFNALRADLFAPAATALIDEVGLSNEATQRVLQHLLLSKESKGRKGSDRGFISYAELGINQLGAVYEGLMSYTGFFAAEDLYEVAKNGDPEKGSWVIPVTHADHLVPSDFVTSLDEATGEQVPVIHRQGTFVYRLAGRERQQSASYYTPEVLTKFVVSQALEELLDQDGERTTPEQVLQLTICEPALGSGAFAIEAVRQLAAEYLKRKQEELGQVIDADQYQVELQKVKAYLALHQVYGVDLNATAVELAEISLWLDTMVAGLQAPWFGLHLRRGNSLIGARRAVYAPNLLAKKAWLTTAPEDKPLGEEIGAGIHHFLLPSQGWGAVIDTPEAKTYAPDKREELRLWRNGIRSNPSAAIKKRLTALAERVETLWEFTLRRLTIAESEIRRDIDIWGFQRDDVAAQAVTREQIEAVLQDENGAYRRLRRVMDAWCALWSWPLTTGIEPPDWDQWVGGLEAILGVPPKAGKFEKYGQTSLAHQLDWDELDAAEDNDRVFSQSLSVRKALDAFRWLTVAESIALSQGFFHWEIDFAPVLARGGFDLQVGNPPWVRPAFREPIELAEFDPWWQLSDKSSKEQEAAKRQQVLTDQEKRAWLCDRLSTESGTKSHISSDLNFPLLSGTTPNLYRNFIANAWRFCRSTGIIGLLHPSNHLKDDAFVSLRQECYKRLRRNWEFRNQLRLFSEIGNTRPYSACIYGNAHGSVDFLHASWILHPDTVSRSLVHDGRGTPPGIKNEAGWDVSPHRSRIFRVTDDVVQGWAKILRIDAENAATAPTISTPNKSMLSMLTKVASAESAVSGYFRFSQGWSESTYLKKGIYRKKTSVPASWSEVILQSPQIGVGNALFQQPNPTAKSHRDYSEIDLDGISDDFLPRTNYQPAVPLTQFVAQCAKWDGTPYVEFFRIAWSEMCDTFGRRTLQSCLIPRGATHVHAINSAADLSSASEMVCMLGASHSIVMDAVIKLMGVDHMKPEMWQLVPRIVEPKIRRAILLRTMRLNAVTSSYGPLWSDLFDDDWRLDNWCPSIGVQYADRRRLGDIDRMWTSQTPLRACADRRQALVEIDALIAVALQIPADELLTIYRGLFPVDRQIEAKTAFDCNGRAIPRALASEAIASRGAVEALSFEGVTYRGPFSGVDREQELELAHKHFSGMVRV